MSNFIRSADDFPEERLVPTQKGIASVETAVQVLRLLEASSGPLSLKEISDAIGFSASKAHHYLVSLTRCGLLERERGSLRYQLGSFSLQLGLTALGRMGTANVVADALRTLRDEIGYSTGFAIWSERGPMVTHFEDGKAGVSVSLRLGTVLPMINSPTAAIFIAWLADIKLQTALALLPAGALPLSRLVEIREQTRREGGSHASGVRSPQIAGVAAPVFGAQGQLVGAMLTIGLVGQFDDRPGSGVSVVLHRHATALSSRFAARY